MCALQKHPCTMVKENGRTVAAICQYLLSGNPGINWWYPGAVQCLLRGSLRFLPGRLRR